MKRVPCARYVREAQRAIATEEKRMAAVANAASGFARVRSTESAVKRLMMEGPAGWGSVPAHALVVRGQQYVHDDDVHRTGAGAFAELLRNVMRWYLQQFSDPIAADFPKNFREYPNLWEWQIFAGGQESHPCWHSESRRFSLSLFSLSDHLAYQFYRGFGHPPVPVFEAVWDGIANGYWPIGIKDGQAVIWSDDYSLIGKPSKAKPPSKSATKTTLASAKTAARFSKKRTA